MAPTPASSVSPLYELLRRQSRVVSPEDPEVLQAAFSWFLGTPPHSSSITTPTSTPSTPRRPSTSPVHTSKYADGTPRRARRPHSCRCTRPLRQGDYAAQVQGSARDIISKTSHNQNQYRYTTPNSPYTVEFIKFISKEQSSQRRLVYRLETEEEC